VPGSQLAHDLWVRRQRQEARRSRNAIALDDSSPVMQRAAGLKDREQEIARQRRIESNAALNKRAKADIALYNDERAGFLLGELLESKKQLISGLAAL
jgi:hypothetical protein